MTLGVNDSAAINMDAMRDALAVAGGIKDQKVGSAKFVTMVVTRDPPTVVRVHLSCADDAELYKVKRLMMASFDSKEEANERFVGAAVVSTGAPFFFGLTPPPPPPPTLSIILAVKNADAVTEEMKSELTGTLAETLSLPLGGGRRLTADVITAEVTGDTEITVRISGEGLDLFEMYRTLRPRMDALGKINDLLYGCPPDDCRMDCFQFGCGAEFPFKEPVYSGITHPPPSPPPPLPPAEPLSPSASETVAGVEEEPGEESSGSSLGTILLVLGILFFLCSACIAVYLVKSKVP